MSKRIRFLMIGGFLGAGKTTAIARIAKGLMDSGLNVGLVTNDQAYDLVDTQSLRAQGFRVGEVPGACFCCKFSDLIETAAALTQEQRPDVIITEPVGSCTDLVATVIEPLRHLHDDDYELAPLAVLLKPEHGRKILGDESGVGFSPKAAYIFLKQIEEAGIVVLNKVDKLSSDQLDQLLKLVEQRFPDKRIVAASAKTGEGFDELVDLLTTTEYASLPTMDVDYDVYAEGEAELGWLNTTAHVTPAGDGQSAFALDALLVKLVERLGEALLAASAEPAHLKVLGMSGRETGIANLVGSDAGVELSLASEIEVTEADLIVNARVAVDPEVLASVVREQLSAVGGELGLAIELGEIQHFRPGRPVPTHRMTVA
jgi:G3E family GTPase